MKNPTQHRKYRLLAQLAGIGIIAGMLPLLAAGPAQGADYWESEKNNSTATANRLPLGAIMHGSISGTSTSDSDYYSFDLTRPGRLGLELRFPNNLGTGNVYRLRLYDATGNTRFSFDVPGGHWNGAWASQYAMYLQAGRYYAEIKGHSHRASWGKPYTLRVTSTPGTVEAEPNNTSATANRLSLGTTISGSVFAASTSDSDYYSFDLTRPGRLGLELKFPNNLGTGSVYRLKLYDATGNTRFSFDVPGGHWNGAWASQHAMYLQAGRYYAEIKGHSHRASWGKPYTLRVTPMLTASQPRVSGKPSFGKTLTVETGAWAPSGAKLTYQWLRDGKAIRGATQTTYRLTAADVGRRISVRVTGSLNGYPSASSTSSQTKAVPGAKLAKTPAPKIAGNAKTGKTLKVKTATWKPSGVKLSYQWYRNGKKVKGATQISYKLARADKGKKLTVKVTGRKPGYTTVTKTSKPTTNVR